MDDASWGQKTGSAFDAIDAVPLVSCMFARVRTYRDVYQGERVLWSKACADVLEEMENSRNPYHKLRMLKWWVVLPQLLLYASSNGRPASRKHKVVRRLHRFDARQLEGLLVEWQRTAEKRHDRSTEGSVIDQAMELLANL
jgi:hypothetical protein